jgi:hypothetical protein
MNAAADWKAGQRVIAGGEPGEIAAIDNSPFGGYWVRLDTGSQQLCQLEELERPVLDLSADADLAEARREPGLSAAENFLHGID